MELRLSLSSNSDAFINYLKNFAKMRSSLLLEIDVKKSMFVAKTVSEDRSSVRYSAIDFDTCNISVSPDADFEISDRIKLGILNQLPKLIKMCERFGSDLDGTDQTSFSINIVYDKVLNPDNTFNYVSSGVGFSSKALSMKFDGFKLTEFRYMTDDVFFNTVFSVSDAICFELSPELIDNTVKTSDIIKRNPKEDLLFISVKDSQVFAHDVTKQSLSNFNYNLCSLSEKSDVELSVPIRRDTFIRMFSKTEETFKVSLGKSVKGVLDRVVFDSLNSPTKIVISAVSE